MLSRPSRRTFIKSLATAGAVTTLSASSWSRVLGANERLRIASIGTGGKGWSDLTNIAASPAVDVAVICDIDESAEHLGRAAERFPQAKRFSDWRKVLDEANRIDAVVVSTPDHMHAPISLAAMALGKHVHCQKPLTHTVFEARQMQLAAKRGNLVTQMGNQIQSHEAYRTAVRMVHSGLIGKVKEVHSWQGGTTKWARDPERPAGDDPIPASIHWDLWLGVAPERPFKREVYHPFNWRGWRDFGTGQLGDFGCHILDPVFMALKLTAPTKIKATAPPSHLEAWPKSEEVQYLFPGTEHTAGESLKLSWYDGAGVAAPREVLTGVPQSFRLPNAGSALIGEKGTLIIPHVAAPKLFPAEKFSAADIPHVDAVDHYVQWADACRGEGKTTSHFGYSGPLTEAVLLGTIAVRLPGEELQWDAAALRVTNSAAAQQLLTKPYRKGWEPTWIG